MRYGGRSNGALFVSSSNVTVTNCTISDSATDGIQLSGANLSPTIDTVTVQNNTSWFERQLFDTQLGLGLGVAFTDFVRLELDLARGHEDVISGARAEMPETVAQNGDGTAYTTGTLGLAVEF